ncbi:glycerol-3-phosphate acyltransferase 3 isoform X3 [Tribolium castaneum]|uniref:glycerol-3-phosphate acyltransferase 3 isoform X3 n=1 Tax=Tribolium castaneum TaxID=7070 RepID=UPI0001757D52
MAGILSLVWFIGSVLVTPFLVILLCIVFLASIGKSLGVRRLYVKLLLIIFEYGRANIETAQNQAHRNEDSDDEITAPNNNTAKDQLIKPPNGIKKPNNGYVPNDNSVISRDDKLILLPEPLQKKDEITGEITESKDEYKEYNLSSIFDYLKAGMEAIIEDQVTSRFEAEELKNWNLLIRTNRRYEFISWKLTVIWVCGFFVRYFFLFPLRVTICFFGCVWMLGSTPLLGALPDNSFKRWINSKAYIIAFRIMARSLTGVIRIHNKQYRPARGSVCVANHTTPCDVVILSTDNCYSLVWWLTLCTALVGYVKEGSFKQKLNKYVSIMCFGILSNAISSVITYHNEENKPKNGICVANHTSPIDVLILMCDNCYSLIGQSHGGFLGILQRALARASPHIWFERSEVRDRHAVANKLKEHVSNPKNPPILIFPEGTCINNTSVMQFKKGSFEVGSVIYPVAIKYDPRFGDAFWNSSKYSMMQYLYMMMTSWAIVCDVWYLPPMQQEEGESAIDFANRVKSVIAKQGGLVDLVWDGQLKRTKPKKEWRERQQEEFSKRLKIE